MVRPRLLLVADERDLGSRIGVIVRGVGGGHLETPATYRLTDQTRRGIRLPGFNVSAGQIVQLEVRGSAINITLGKSPTLAGKQAIHQITRNA